MSRIAASYDLSLAIIGASATEQWRQNRQLEECYLAPTRQLLKEFADQNPSEVLCFHNEKHRTQEDVYGPNEQSRWLLMVLPDKKVLLLGMVHDRDGALCGWEHDLEELDPEVRRVREKLGPFAVRLEDGFWHMPMDVDRVTTETCEEAARKFFRAVCPALSDVPIRWLPEKEAYDLSKTIWDKIGTIGPLKDVTPLDQILWEASEP